MPTSRRRQLANAIRALAMDAVQKANSGHPGMPMGMADIAEVLVERPSRGTTRQSAVVRPRPLRGLERSRLDAAVRAAASDRLPVDRSTTCARSASSARTRPATLNTTPTWASRPPPARWVRASRTPSAWRWRRRVLAATFNRPGFDVVDHRTWVFLGDGCLMEGVSHEACSLAGTLRLGKLIAFYDDNGISIDGEVHGWFTDDTPKRFEAYGWHVVPDVDGHDPQAVEAAIAAAKARKRPAESDLLQDDHRLRCAQQAGHRSDARRGAGRRRSRRSPQAARLAVRAVRRFPTKFAAAGMRASAARSAKRQWRATFQRVQARNFPELAAEYERRMRGELPSQWRDVVESYVAQSRAGDGGSLATRQSSQQALNAYGPALARAARRLGRPHGLEQHESQGLAHAHRRRSVGQLPPLRRARVRHGGDHERHRACTAASSLTAARSWCSRTTRATPCAWPR